MDKNIIPYQPPSGTTLTSDKLADLIVDITKAMKSDFGQQYSKQFCTDEDLRQYKRRLYKHLRNRNLDDIMNAYEDYILAGNKFCPNIPELLEHVAAAAINRRRTETNKTEAQRIGNTPAPTIECNPLEMLKAAREALRQNPPTGEERAAALKAHEALLYAHRDKISRYYVDNDHRCHVGYCDNHGTLSHGTTGGGNFYCAEHFRRYD
jgi:hypothetical protein